MEQGQLKPYFYHQAVFSTLLQYTACIPLLKHYESLLSLSRKDSGFRWGTRQKQQQSLFEVSAEATGADIKTSTNVDFQLVLFLLKVPQQNH